MTERTCLTCGKKFVIPDYRAKWNAGKYCSKQCTKTGIPPTDPSKRFWSKVNKTDSCWLWTASTHKFGYGAFNVRGKVYTGHAYSWYLAHNSFPSKGQVIMHTCDNPTCVNPQHLQIATQKENVEDCTRKGRQAKGEDKSKLTTQEVKAIRTLYKPFSRKYSARKLAQIFKSTHQNISCITRRKSWKHIK